jgi:hypothetical protein
MISDSTPSAIKELMHGRLSLQIRPMVTQHGTSVILGEPQFRCPYLPFSKNQEG